MSEKKFKPCPFCIGGVTYDDTLSRIHAMRVCGNCKNFVLEVCPTGMDTWDGHRCDEWEFNTYTLVPWRESDE